VVRQLVLQHYEQLFQFGRDLDDGREDHNKRAVLFALIDLSGKRLDDLSTVQEPVEVHQHE
jgi:hypothetical protein